jgi:hypothetical protein
MTINEAGDNRHSLRIEHPGALGGKVPDLGIRAHREETAVLDRERLGAG